MAGYLLAPWTTVSSGSGASLTQDAYYWLNFEDFSDAAFWIDCTDVSGNVSLHIESSPTPDETFFADVVPPIALAASSSPIVAKTVRTPTTQALSRNTRWRLDVPSGAWSATFRIRAVPLRSRSFVPPDVSGCQLWLRSDLGVTLGAGGGGVTTWADQSGNGHDATAAGGQQPGYTISSINNLPSVDCDGTTSLIATAAFNLGTYTVLMVTTGQDVIPGVTAIGYFWTRSAAMVNHDTLYGTTTNTTEVNRAGSLSAYNYVANWGSWGSTARVLAQLFDGTHAGHRLRMNAAELGLTSVSAVDPGTLGTSDQFVIAARNDGFLRSKIKVAEVVVYDHSLLADDLARVEQYLRRRYALF
jgi:hypothetical protein